jgi:hypothetical protein
VEDRLFMENGAGSTMVTADSALRAHDPELERLAMRAAQIMTAVSLVAAVTAATVVGARHVKKASATSRVVATTNGTR